MKPLSSFFRSAFFFSALAGASLAQGPARGLPSDRVYYDDTRGDGSIWARGATYKASFDASGATYIPFLGSAAPRNYPVSFRLASVSVGGEPLVFDASAPAARSGDVIDFDRGSFVERYSMAPESMEQQFVFAHLPASGDLVLRIEVESDLAGADGLDRIELSNELGAVRYGRATILDRTGASAPAATVLSEGGIEIRVPASFLATARFPVTIDPIVSTFAIDITTRDDFDPDVAYEGGTDRYLVVYEEIFSVSDHDIVGRLLDSTGAFLQGGIIDPTGESWGRPRCASNRVFGNFLVVAVGNGGLRGRTIAASDFVMGSATTLHNVAGGNTIPHHDVGGDSAVTGSSQYCVVAEIATPSLNLAVITMVMVNPVTGDPAGPLVGLSGTNSVLDTNPSISKSNGDRAVLPAGDVNWNVVWQREVTALNHDTLFARIHFDGFITTPATVDDPLGHDTTTPCVSPPLDSGRWMIVYDLRVGTTEHDLHGRLYDHVAFAGNQFLTALEAAAGSGTESQDQITPSIDSDGQSFVLAYAESFHNSATNYNTFVSSLRPSATGVVLSESHRVLANSTSRESHTQVATTRSGGGARRRAMIVWDDATTGSQLGNIEGGLYDTPFFTSYCDPGEDARSCPCGNPASGPTRGCNNSSNTGGARLTASGAASLAGDTVSFLAAFTRPTASCTFLQGSAQLNNAFGMGVRCVGGSLKRLYQKNAVGGQASAPTGAELRVSARSAAMGDVIAPGSSRFYQVQYRDPVVLGGCSPTLTFNITQGVMILWAP